MADAQRLFAEALAASLGAHADLDVSEEPSTTGRQILKEVTRRKPQVALIDFWISDMAGPAAARAVVKASPSTRVLFLTEFRIGPVQAAQARAVGALGFLQKDLAIGDVVTAIRAASSAPAAKLRRAEAPSSDRAQLLMGLSAREMEVLQMLRQGFSAKEAAAELSISAGTVKNHIHNILRKTKASNQIEAMIKAEAEGLISGG